jgi:hypothetical protein
VFHKFLYWRQLTIVLNAGQLDNTWRGVEEASNAEGLEHHLESCYKWPDRLGHQEQRRDESKEKCLTMFYNQAAAPFEYATRQG